MHLAETLRQRRRPFGSRTISRGENHPTPPLRRFRQHSQHVVHPLIRPRREYADQSIKRKMRPRGIERTRQRLAVMRTVQNNHRPPRDDLEPPRPARLRQAAKQRGAVEFPPRANQPIRRRQRQCAVVRLETTQQRHANRAAVGVPVEKSQFPPQPPTRTNRPNRDRQVLADYVNRTPHRRRSPTQRFRRLRRLRRSDDRHAWLKNPRLLDRDLAQRLAELFRMIDPDPTHQAYRRFANRRAVQPPAHAGFHDRRIDLLVLEVQPRQCGKNLEKRRRIHRPHHIQRLGHAIHQRRQPPLGDQPIPDANPLADIFQVRTAIQPHLQSAAAEHCSQHCRRRAFALRPCDMNCPHPPLRIPQKPHQPPRTIQVEGRAVIADLLHLLVIGPRKQESQSRFIIAKLFGHGPDSPTHRSEILTRPPAPSTRRSRRRRVLAMCTSAQVLRRKSFSQQAKGA